MSISRLDSVKCYGCSACMGICRHDAIHMHDDSEGFIRPVVDTKKCNECGLCEKVCPAMKTRQVNEGFSQHIYAAYSKDDDVISKSTSGGVFYHIAEMIIKRGGVVYGAVYDQDFHVTHTCAHDLAGVRAMHGAKYVQSHLSEMIYHDIQTRLQKGQWVLFSGTPCQTDAVRSYLRKDYERLLLCDLVCRSVSSPKIYSDYLTFVQRKKKLKTVNMRWKENGWKNTKFHLEFNDGSQQTAKGAAQLWHDIHFSGIVTRPSCHQCPYTNMFRTGDITLGDFWGIRKSHADFYHHQGVSLVMVNTEKGAVVFDEISSSLNIQPSSAKACSQPALRTPVIAHPNRKSFWIEYPDASFEKLARKYFKYGWLNQRRRQLRTILSPFIRRTSTTQ